MAQEMTHPYKVKDISLAEKGRMRIDWAESRMPVLMKLREYKTNFELSRLFSVNVSTVHNIFVTWINFLYCQWKDINWWSTRDLVRFYSPRKFLL